MHSIAIATPSLNAYSETFIRAHIERLPARVRLLYGGVPPRFVDDGQPIVPSFTLKEHLRWTALRRLKRLTWEDWQQEHLVAALRAMDVRVVLAEYGPTGLSLLAACEKASIPLVVHFHGHDAYGQQVLQGPGRHYARLFEGAAAIVAVSRAMEQQLLRLGAPLVKLHYNPYGVDVEMFGGGDPARAPATFLAVGRFVDKKAPDLTLHAFGRALTQVPCARLQMIGDGPLHEACSRLARTLGIERQVEFLGVRSHAEVASRMASARAFVQHSITALSGDSEGTPVAVLEAQASGLPVVSTRHAGIPEVVQHGHTGVLVDEGDVDGMAEAMIRLAQDPESAARMGAAGRERICAEFSMEKSIANLWRILQSVMKD